MYSIMKSFFNEVYEYTHKLTNKWKRLWFSLLLLKLLSIGSPAEANNNKVTDSNLAKIELEKHNTARVDENLWYTPLLTDLLKSSPDEANNKTTDINLENIEQKDSTDIIWNIERDTWIKFPASYRERFCDFVYNHPTMKRDFIIEYTKKFIKEKLSEDWWIDKSNQLLFICSAIENKVSGESLYKNLEEINQKRKEDFKNTAIRVFRVWKAYTSWLINLANNISAKSEARSMELAEKNKKTEEDINKIKEDNIKKLKDGLKELMESYKEYENNPRDEVLKELRASAKRRLIPGCRENGINPHDFLTPEACKDLGF